MPMKPGLAVGARVQAVTRRALQELGMHLQRDLPSAGKLWCRAATPAFRLPTCHLRMSQPSEDLSPEASEQPKPSQALAERPSSELQRAVQMRAQESMARQRARASQRPNPMRRVVMFALALIPVAALFTAVDGLLRVFHHINQLYNSPEATATATMPSEPEATVSEPQPGVVMLERVEDAPRAAPAAPKP
jgi:hypothetical protein